MIFKRKYCVRYKGKEFNLNFLYFFKISYISILDPNQFKILNHMLQRSIYNILEYQAQVYLSIFVSDILVSVPFACTECEKSECYKCMIWLSYRLQLYKSSY